MILSKYFKSVTYQWLRRRRVVSPQLGSARTFHLPQPATIWIAKKWSGCEPEHGEVFGHSNCPCVVIGGRPFVLNRKNEVLCFVGVAQFWFRESGSFVLNRNWRFGGRSTAGRLAGSTDGRALERLRVRFEIFTDSSSSCGARNAKRCVCTGTCRPGRGAAFEPVQQSARQYI
jgi:hypothetical protein